MAIAETARMLAQADYKDNISAGVAKSIKSVDRLEKRFSRLGSQAQKGLGNAAKNIERLAVIGIGGAAAALTYSVAKAVDWESAIAGVNKTIEATPDELKAITDGLIAMSNRMPTSATDLANIAEAAGALGIAKADILSFTETVALIGSTTNVSTDEAATALGQLSNVLKLTGQDYDNFAAALVDLGNKGASTEGQILEIEKRSGAAAKLIGVAKEATLGWSAAAANLGLNEELAGTSLQNFFLKALPLYTSGSKTLQEITGQTAKQLKQSFKKDASGALESLLADLGRMPKDARLAAVQKLFGKGSGLTRLILGLSDSVSQNLTPSLDTATTAWKENTAAAAEAEKRFATTESQLATLKNNVDNAAVTIGSQLLPLINDLAKEAVGWISSHQDDIKRFGQDLADGLREAVKWARSLNWDAITKSLQAAAGFARGLVEAFLGLPTWVQTAVITGWGLNKLTGGALADIVGSLASGLIKGVLGITAGVVNINAATVTGAGGLPGGAAAPAAGAAGGIGLGGAAIGAGTLAGLIGGPIVQQLTVNGANQELAAAGIEGQLQAMQNAWDIGALVNNTVVLVDGINQIKTNTSSSSIAEAFGAAAHTLTDDSIAAAFGSSTAKLRVPNDPAIARAIATIREPRATDKMIVTNLERAIKAIHDGGAIDDKGYHTLEGSIKGRLRQAIESGDTRLAHKLESQLAALHRLREKMQEAKEAIRNKKLSVKVRLNQHQRQAINAAISANTGSGPSGKRGFHYTSDQGHALDVSRVLAKGAVGLANQATPAIFGEAGPEAFAILRNPRKGTLGGGVPIVHVHVNIDPRRITRKQTSSGVYKTYVAT